MLYEAQGICRLEMHDNNNTREKMGEEKKILIGTKEGRKKHNIDEQNKINRKTIDINLICYLSVLYIDELNSQLKGFLHWIK